MDVCLEGLTMKKPTKEQVKDVIEGALADAFPGVVIRLVEQKGFLGNGEFQGGAFFFPTKEEHYVLMDEGEVELGFTYETWLKKRMAEIDSCDPHDYRYCIALSIG